MYFIHRLALTFSLAVLVAISAHAAVELTVPYSESLKDKARTAINVEMGGYDVTQFARFDSGKVTLKIETPLASGNYTVTVKAYYTDGDVQTLAQQQVDIRQQGVDSWQYNTMLKAGYRLEEDDVQDYSESPRKYHSASVQGSLHANAGTWEISSSASAMYESNTAAAADSWLLPGYQVEAQHNGDYGTTRIGAGNVMMGDNNLLFSNYQRRGIKVGTATAGGLAEVDLFATLTNITNSADEQLMVKGDSDQESHGGVVRIAPLSSARDQLLLSVGYVDGSGSAGGAGFNVADPDTLYGGSSWNVSVDALWLDSTVRLYAEYAGSDFDSDGLDLGDKAKSDSAGQIMLQLIGSPSMALPGLEQWDMTLQHQIVGYDFYSIANLAMAGDISSSVMVFNGRQQTWGFTAELSTEHNNVDDDPQRATQQIDYVGFDADFTPQVDEQSGSWQLLGKPAFSGYLHVMEVSQDDGDEVLTGSDVDQLSTDLNLSSQFSKTNLDWGLGYNLTEVQDNSDEVQQNGVVTHTPVADNTTHLISLFTSWAPSAVVTITPTLEWLDYSESGTDNTHQAVVANLDTQFQLVEERLFLSMNYSVSQMEEEYDDPQADTLKNSSHSGNLELLWKSLLAKNNRPGMDLFLNGSFARDSDDEANALIDKAWQLHLGFVVTFAGSNK